MSTPLRSTEAFGGAAGAPGAAGRVSVVVTGRPGRPGTPCRGPCWRIRPSVSPTRRAFRRPARRYRASSAAVRRNVRRGRGWRVPRACRIRPLRGHAWSGMYVHAAPWNSGNFGSANTSSGCVGMSDANAAAFYESVQAGDLFEVVGSGSKGKADIGYGYGYGYGEWNLSWDDWKARSALNAASQNG
ncbi:L,D-transpeptidase [Streptomyces sp. ISL-86]|uniref:L,D-transpeptidase n=1 Tax=Streptomyces sp. ISL-86 TaxID=2819187 RepID=UPI0027E3D03E|nr:L,D-transpeptidase [Streptomyces sp. ISL-86]